MRRTACGGTVRNGFDEWNTFSGDEPYQNGSIAEKAEINWDSDRSIGPN